MRLTQKHALISIRPTQRCMASATATRSGFRADEEKWCCGQRSRRKPPWESSSSRSILPKPQQIYLLMMCWTHRRKFLSLRPALCRSFQPEKMIWQIQKWNYTEVGTRLTQEKYGRQFVALLFINL